MKHMKYYVKMVSNGSKTPLADTLERTILELQTDQSYKNDIDSIIQRLHTTKYGYDVKFTEAIPMQIYQDVCNDLISRLRN